MHLTFENLKFNGIYYKCLGFDDVEKINYITLPIDNLLPPTSTYIL